MSDDVESQARQLGWVPETEFRGDPGKWVDAETFVERGKTVMPILKANNKKLEDSVSQLKGEVSRLTGLYEASQDAINAMREFHEEDVRNKVKQARAGLLEELKAAKREGDVDREVEIQDEIHRLDTEQVKAKERDEKKPDATPPAPQINPVMKQWIEDHPWYGKDAKRTALAGAIATEMRQEDPEETLQGREFLDEVARRVDEFMGASRATTKVMGAGRPSSGGRGRSYDDLPADAKDTVERQANRMVGPGRAFKTKAEWQKYYADLYFKEVE